MNPLVASLVVGALAVSAVTTATLGVAAWRIRETPGAVPFLGLMVAVTVYTTGYLAGSVSSPAVRVFWEQVHWVGIAFVPVCFLAFAMDYLGHDDHLAAVVGATSVPSVGMIALVWTNGGHRLVFTGERVVDMSGLAVLSQDFGPVYWAFLVYAYALILVGSYLLVRLAVLSEYLYLDQSLSLLVGVVVPLVGNALSVFQVPAVPPVSVPGLDLTPFAFTITGVAFGNATFRYRLFDLVPATWQIGRETVVGSLDDGVVIVDTDRTVVYLNDVAADIFDATVETAVGTDIEYLVDADDVGLGAPDALGELELDSRTYEVRSSEVRDRHDRHLGYTLVFNDITERKARERTLARQRDELRTLNGLNAVIRGVNEALIGADSRGEVDRLVCDRLTESELYDAAWTVDRTLAEAAELPATPRSDGGDAVEGDLAAGQTALPDRAERAGVPEALMAGEGDSRAAEHAGTVDPDADGAWTTVPLVYGRTVFGVLVLFTTRGDAFGERELAVLDELGGSIGHAIHAMHTDRVLLVESVVELEFASREDALAVASGATGTSVTVEGLDTAGDGELTAYCQFEDGDPEETVASLADVAPVESVRHVGETLFQCRLSGGSLAVPLWEYGADFQSVRASDGTCVATACVSADADVRQVVERVETACPDADLRAKRRRDASSAGATDDADPFADLTDRQRETLEAAYAAGYFEWPRDATAEDVADDLEIASPTLHNHLRKAQNRVLGDLLEDAGGR